MALLQGSSGRMIYWARFACAPDNTAKINEQLRSEGLNTDSQPWHKFPWKTHRANGLK